MRGSYSFERAGRVILHVSPGLCSCHTNVAAVSQSEPHDFTLVSRLSLVSLVFLSPVHSAALAA